jgi:hypothetical protein
MPVYENVIKWFNRAHPMRCFYCGGALMGHAGLLKYEGFVLRTKDHVKARSQGGKNHKSNVVPCCSECNMQKAHNDVDAFRMGKYFEKTGTRIFFAERLFKIRPMEGGILRVTDDEIAAMMGKQPPCYQPRKGIKRMLPSKHQIDPKIDFIPPVKKTKMLPCSTSYTANQGHSLLKDSRTASLSDTSTSKESPPLDGAIPGQKFMLD